MRRRWHNYFLWLCGAILLVACGGPTAPEDSSLLSDADLDAAVQMQESQTPAPSADPTSLDASGIISRDETGTAGLFGATREGRVACVAFCAGIALFSGSLYVMTLTGARFLGAVTPLGGLALLAGWAALAVAAFRAG